MSITSLIELSCLRLTVKWKPIYNYVKYTSTNLAQSVTLLTYNQEERGSDLDWDTDHPD